MNALRHVITRPSAALAVAAVLAGGMVVARPASARVDFHINLSAGVPGFVVIPGSRVSYCDAYDRDLYAYGGRFYTCDADGWYVSDSYNGRYRPIRERSVPIVVIDVYGSGRGYRRGGDVRGHRAYDYVARPVYRAPRWHDRDRNYECDGHDSWANGPRDWNDGDARFGPGDRPGRGNGRGRGTRGNERDGADGNRRGDYRDRNGGYR